VVYTYCNKGNFPFLLLLVRSDPEKIRDLEDEQEELNGSLLALTSHFAQVQFRLKQVVAAPTETRERLLMELEEFAFQGCPDVRGPKAKESPTKAVDDSGEGKN
ncbi:RUN domain-containing protein 1-like, partial [Stylophora pistillata]|uniref:RUN domain-containing protein 1-like n=1 Tax=Stylophora pistillata TaxID=50429 RepID=UPI000C041FBF